MLISLINISKTKPLSDVQHICKQTLVYVLSCSMCIYTQQLGCRVRIGYKGRNYAAIVDYFAMFIAVFSILLHVFLCLISLA